VPVGSALDRRRADHLGSVYACRVVRLAHSWLPSIPPDRSIWRWVRRGPEAQSRRRGSQTGCGRGYRTPNRLRITSENLTPSLLTWRSENSTMPRVMASHGCGRTAMAYRESETAVWECRCRRSPGSHPEARPPPTGRR
jgi:hypothetical protein